MMDYAPQRFKFGQRGPDQRQGDLRETNCVMCLVGGKVTAEFFLPSRLWALADGKDWYASRHKVCYFCFALMNESPFQLCSYVLRHLG